MKTISVCQPWAQLIVSGAKTIETRSWHTPYRGRLAVHASKTCVRDFYDLCARGPYAVCLTAAGFAWPGDLPRGVLLGTVDLIDCRRAEDLEPTLSEVERYFGHFGPGRWGWVLANPVPLVHPVAYRGALGLFDVPDELLHEPRCA